MPGHPGPRRRRRAVSGVANGPRTVTPSEAIDGTRGEQGGTKSRWAEERCGDGEGMGSGVAGKADRAQRDPHHRRPEPQDRRGVAEGYRPDSCRNTRERAWEAGALRESTHEEVSRGHASIVETWLGSGRGRWRARRENSACRGSWRLRRAEG